MTNKIIKIFYFTILLFLSYSFLSYANSDYGLSLFKKGNCKSCHQWHGDGGASYGGAAVSLRTTGLERDDLITLISCGRPGTNMPFFDKMAYKDDRCFGLTFKDFEGEDANRPLPARKKLNNRQIQAVVDFIISDLKGKEVTKEYCIKYFGKPTRACESY
tara:strand:+ start:66 stop:545 length:480 start_codon:yes stop_codon:yes gene_type:complete